MRLFKNIFSGIEAFQSDVRLFKNFEAFKTFKEEAFSRSFRRFE
jgi:hypothetical protein